MEEICHELIIQGFVPVIAHPERNAEIAADPSKLEIDRARITWAGNRSESCRRFRE